MNNSGIMDEAAVQTVSVKNKQTRLAVSYPQSVSLQLLRLSVVCLPTLSDTLRVKAERMLSLLAMESVFITARIKD